MSISISNVQDHCTTSITGVNINYCMAIKGSDSCGW